MENQAQKLLKKLGVGAAVVVATVGQAHAELPAAVTTAMTDAATDGAAMATLGLLVIVAIAAVMYLRRAK